MKFIYTAVAVIRVLKGGDIDLFWLVQEKDLPSCRKKKNEILSELSRRLREQKIDLTLIGKKECLTDSFFLKLSQS